MDQSENKAPKIYTQAEIENFETQRRRFEERLRQEGLANGDEESLKDAAQAFAREEWLLRERHPDEMQVIRESGAIEDQIIATIKAKEALGIDFLTGAVNSRKFTQELTRLQAEAEIRRQRARRTRKSDVNEVLKEEPFSMLALDVNKFKRINDDPRYGHLAGDAVLREIVRRIQGRIRQGDFIARLGGDEFCVIVLATNGAAPKVAESLSRLISEKPVSYKNPSTGEELEIPVTISIGVAPYDKNTAAMRENADRALYKAKTMSAESHHVCVWNQETQEPEEYNGNSRDGDGDAGTKQAAA